ncbi:MAG: hypothetical protein ACHQIK_00870 [Candidatus Acidiferrales bacterium]
MDTKQHVAWLLIGGLASAQILSESLGREEKHIEFEQERELPALVGTLSATSISTNTSSATITSVSGLNKT